MAESRSSSQYWLLSLTKEAILSPPLRYGFLFSINNVPNKTFYLLILLVNSASCDGSVICQGVIMAESRSSSQCLMILPIKEAVLSPPCRYGFIFSIIMYLIRLPTCTY